MRFPPLVKKSSILLGLLLALAPVAASAHTGTPVQTTTVDAGAYTLDVMIYSEPHTSWPIPIRIAPRLPARQRELAPLKLQVTMQPGLGTDATPVKAVVYPDPDDHTMYAADPMVVVRGAWVLEIQAQGPDSTGTARIPLTVAAPAAMPLWLGWLLGFSPLLGVIWFAWWQWRWMKSRRAGSLHSPVI
jgi:hypothetical protein